MKVVAQQIAFGKFQRGKIDLAQIGQRNAFPVDFQRYVVGVVGYLYLSAVTSETFNHATLYREYEHVTLREDAAATIDSVEVRAYTVPTATPESDGTLEWDATTLVYVEVAPPARAALVSRMPTSRPRS